MSVTFFAANAPSIPTAIYDNRDGDFEHGGPEIIVVMDTPFEMNVSNYNASTVLDMLGQRNSFYNEYEGRWNLVGVIDVDDLRDALDAVSACTYEEDDRYKGRLEDSMMYCIAINSPLHFG